MSSKLDDWFGPRQVNGALVSEALKGALNVMVHGKARVMVQRRGSRVDVRLSPVAEAEVLRALDEGVLHKYMPRVERNSANLRRRS